MKLTKLELWLYSCCLALFFCIPAFYNGFPLLFPDSSTYINSGFINKVSGSRPWFYSGFIRHVSLFETLWLVVFGQGLLIAGVIYLMFKEFYKGANKEKLYVFYSLIVGATTAVSFHVSRLMPDIFTPIVILLFILLLLEKHLNWKERIFAVLLFIIASGMHNAHLVMTVGMILVLFFGSLFKSLRAEYKLLGITKKRVGLLLLWIVCTHLSVCTVHYSMSGKFVATKGGSIFLFARLYDFGIAQAYLKEHCGEDLEGKICENQKKIFYSGTFLWHKDSYLNKNGGWTAENEAYFGELTKKILTTPKYLKSFLIHSVEATFMQLFKFEYSPIAPNIKWVTKAVESYYPMYLPAADGSLQMKNVYNKNYVDFNNIVQQFVLFISVLLILFLFWSSNVSKEQKALTLLLLFALLINAFIAAATSGAYDRYQSRVNWLITLPVFWFVCNRLGQMEFFKHKKIEDELTNR